MLHNDKPGTGFKDAPRCFSLKLEKATRGRYQAKPLSYDDQLLVKHKHGRLVFIASVHVDDIKVACDPAELKEFIAALTYVFGESELDITAKFFTNCGMRHTLLEGGGYLAA